ncbi:hypothetical protein PROFUN_01585 [Planoprotostelium fungivorum]|uniref:Uncharacterized protein n=1 Tax=Planoprotostelium fungivorum TaxID=1890364 RepID=A0A2P6NTM2_9EUKA|nr:hypothetical protein PROFUN_01585 [Planoprotostelium fungivorum]
MRHQVVREPYARHIRRAIGQLEKRDGEREAQAIKESCSGATTQTNLQT